MQEKLKKHIDLLITRYPNLASIRQKIDDAYEVM